MFKTVPLEGCRIGRIPQLDLVHQSFKQLDVLIGNRLVNQDSAVGLAMLSTVVVDGIVRPVSSESVNENTMASQNSQVACH